MRVWTGWVVALVIGATSGCAVVYVTRPVGEVPAAVKGSDWDGTWVNQDGALTLKVLDEEAGRIQIAGVEWSVQGPRLESHEMLLLRSGDATFASVKEAEENGQALYVWARVKRDGSQLICWIPDADRFKDACRAGRFPFREKDDSIVLGDLTPDHVKLLASAEEGLLYRWDDPVVFLRLSCGDHR